MLKHFFTAIAVLLPYILYAQASKLTISGRIADSETKLPVPDVFVQASGSEIYAFTSEQGYFKLSGQLPGKTTIRISQVGRKALELDYFFTKDTTIQILIDMLSLALDEVSVVSKERRIGSASVLDKTAIRHNQPTSLADALQLLPGQLSANPDLSSAQQINLRQVPSNSDAARANALGTAIVLDGIPYSNNANMQTNVNILNASPGTLPEFSSVAGRGNDLRQIPADQIESIEVIRGIPSSRYGDLTAGAVLVNTRAGVFRPQFTTRVNPNLIQQSVGFGVKLKGNWGILSTDNSISYSEEDPRNKLSQYTRFNSQFTWSRSWFEGKLFTTNRFTVFNTLDNNKQDPNDLRYQRRIYSRDQGFRFSSNGKLNTYKSWFSLIEYDLGVTYTDQKSYLQELVTRDLFPISDATENITKAGRYGESEYLSIVNTTGKPLSLYGRLEGTVFKRSGITDLNISSQLLAGIETRYDANYGEGRQFDPTKPPRQNYSMGDRPRSYADIPGLGQLSYYAENRLSALVKGRTLDFHAGLRYDNIQPENPVSGKYGNILAPRLNVAIETIKHLRLKAGYGITAKAPTLSYMYPGDRYFDLVNYNYYANNPAERLVIISTVVFDTKNENLKSYRAKKFELGLDYDYKGLTWFLSAFKETTTGAFGTDRYVHLLEVAKLSASSFPVDQPPVLNPEPDRYEPFFAAYDMTNNNRRIENKGIEFQVTTPSIPHINTSFNFNGAYITTVSYDDGNAVDANRAVFSDVTPERVPVFRSGFGNKGDRFNTSLRFITRIPAFRFLVSGLLQTVWTDRNRSLDLSPYPVGYVTNEGQTVYLSPQEAASDEYKDLRRTISSTLAYEENLPPLWLFNVRVTKEFSNGSNLSFYVNNVLSDKGRYFNKVYQQYVFRNDPIFFGAEFTINF